MSEDSRIERIGESLRIIAEGKNHDAVLRMIGGLAVRAHCEDLEFCEREYGDIDLVGLEKESSKIRSSFEALGYIEDRSVAQSTDGTQLLFQRSDTEDHVDVFLNKLRMEHTIDLRDRLQIEKLTISVSDILLTKLIVFVMNEKDYRDIFTIIKDMEFGDTDGRGVINRNYIARTCAKDWGLYQDIAAKIDECLQIMGHYGFSDEDAARMRSRFLAIREAMKESPKSLKWKMRGIIGTRIAWRDTVDEEDLYVTDLSTQLSKEDS